MSAICTWWLLLMHISVYWQNLLPISSHIITISYHKFSMNSVYLRFYHVLCVSYCMTYVGYQPDYNLFVHMMWHQYTEYHIVSAFTVEAPSCLNGDFSLNCLRDHVLSEPNNCDAASVREECCQSCSSLFYSRLADGKDVNTCPYGDKWVWYNIGVSWYTTGYNRLFFILLTFTKLVCVRY